VTADERRLNSYVASLAANPDDARMLRYPGLGTSAWHDPGRFEIVAALEAGFTTIRAEVDGVASERFQRETEPIPRRGDWDVLMLYERGRKHADACGALPFTTRLIESHAAVRTIAGLIYVSRMRAGTHIAPHRGPTNVRVRCHLGLRVPRGDCAIRVCEESRGWQDGRCIVFDDHLEHEAWNRTRRDRLVLVVDLWHPDLGPKEIAFLEGLHRYALAHAQDLSRYWVANARARAVRYH
jgi:aspartyl/asparaginyl beta-hydroxylase (cupin superfamily)